MGAYRMLPIYFSLTNLFEHLKSYILQSINITSFGINIAVCYRIRTLVMNAKWVRSTITSGGDNNVCIEGIKTWATQKTSTIMVDAKTVTDDNLPIPSTYQRDEMALIGAKAATDAAKIVRPLKK